jgi:hypothetical protein
LVEQARAFLYIKKDDRAIALLQEVLRRDATDRSARLELARALAYQQRYTESDELYKQLLQSNMQDEAASLGLIRNLVHEHRLSEARTQTNQALVFHPNSIRLQQYRKDLDQDPPTLSTTVHRQESIGSGTNQIQNWTTFLSDSSGHQMLNSLQRFNYKFNDTISMRMDVGDRYLRSTRSDLGTMNLFSGIMELRARLNPSLAVSGGVGAVRFSDGASTALYRARLDYQPMERLWTTIQVDRHPVAPTVEAARLHLTAQGISANVYWKPGNWQFSGSLARHQYSDGNYRKEETFEGLRWFGAPRLQFGAGYGFRHLAYDEQLRHGYFSPAQYQNHAFVTGIRFRAGKHYRAEYLTHIGGESLIPGKYQFSAEVSLQNRWQFKKWDFTGDYFYYHLAQSTGAFRANMVRFGVGYRF